MCLHVDNEDVNEIEIGRLKRKVKLQDTIAEREEICHEFSERCKQVTFILEQGFLTLLTTADTPDPQNGVTLVLAR